ncbi:MAG TPA: hypothetical protein VN659_16860 [Pyrinomonadaceae bacterium]|nr:hypothetical protein [Pyrinomonadaceae bacterium]
MNAKGQLILILVLLLAGCGGNAPRNANTSEASATPAGPAPSPLKGFEADLQYVKNGQYTYIWVFSRKDGKPFEPADSIFLRANAPQVVDWVTTDEGKKVIAGTNFNLEEGNLELLKKRYVTEDYSNK